MDLRASFGRRLRELRTQRALSQEQLAERAALHWTYVSGIEQGKRSPTLNILGRLAKALKVSLADLLKDVTDARMASKPAKRS